MYVQKRWVFATAVLILVLVGALLGIGTRSLPPMSDSRSIDAAVMAGSGSTNVRISVAGPATAFVSGAADPQPFNACVFVRAGGDTQVNVGNFGDIGLQLQDSSISEFQNGQISIQGNDTVTASNIGPGKVVINGGSTCPAEGSH